LFPNTCTYGISLAHLLAHKEGKEEKGKGKAKKKKKKGENIVSHP